MDVPSLSGGQDLKAGNMMALGMEDLSGVWKFFDRKFCLKCVCFAYSSNLTKQLMHDGSSDLFFHYIRTA